MLLFFTAFYRLLRCYSGSNNDKSFWFCCCIRWCIFCQIPCFSNSLAVPQAAISSNVRQHPSHKPVCALMLQMLMQGEGTGIGVGDADSVILSLQAKPMRLFPPLGRWQNRPLINSHRLALPNLTFHRRKTRPAIRRALNHGSSPLT